MKPLPALSRADQAILEAAMTPSARELVPVIGIAAIVSLVGAFGGQRIFVHIAEPPDSPIAQAIGAEAAARLGAFRGGERFDVPMLTKARRMLRDNAVRSDFDAGASANDLAALHGTTARHIRKLLTARIDAYPRL